jgi:hypothetical protein
MSWLDDMFSLMRNFEQSLKENEQFLNMCEQNAKHLRKPFRSRYPIPR